MTMSPNLENQAAEPAMTDAQKADVHENKDLAAFSYIWIFSILMFLAKRKSPFIQFHAKQGMILFGLSIVFWFIPYVRNVLEFVVLLGCAWGFIQAAQGKWDEVPFIGPLARGKISLRPSLRKAVEGVAKGVDSAKTIWRDSKNESEPTSAPPQTQSPAAPMATVTKPMEPSLQPPSDPTAPTL